MWLDAVFSALNNLKSPALYVLDGVVVRQNPAADAVGLTCRQKLRDCLPQLSRLPQGEEKSHMMAELSGAVWEVTASCLEEGHLILLEKVTLPEQDPLLLSAVRSITPAVEEIIQAGGRLFPQLEELEDEEVQSHSAAISHGCFRLMRTLAELSAYDRLCREDAPLQKEACDVTEFFRDFALRLSDILLEADRKLSYTGPDKTVYGALDKQETKRAVLHLVSNACKFTPAGGTVSLSVKVLGKKLQILVENPGEVDENVLPSVFSRYAYPATTDPRQGAGLGLSLVQAIARRHGGAALMESGRGRTAVTLTLDIQVTENILNSPRVDYTGGYDPALVELSGQLPAHVFDSRSVDL